jgi:hypothetical protein
LTGLSSKKMWRGRISASPRYLFSHLDEYAS